MRQSLVTVHFNNLLHNYVQVAGHTAMLTLGQAVDQFSWMMFSVAPALMKY